MADPRFSTPSIESGIVALDRWLLDSGLQLSVPGLAHGGVSRGYDWKTNTYQYAYSEISGYYLSYLATCRKWTDRDDLVDRCITAADYLDRCQIKQAESRYHGAFIHGVEWSDNQKRLDCYAFDVAMCVQGLMDWYAISNREAVLANAINAAEWLVGEMQTTKGSFRSVMAERDLEKEKKDLAFGDDGCLHAKHAIGLLKVWQATNEEKYRLAAERLCSWVCDLQLPNGGIRSSERTQQIVSHTHCYAVEGLIYAGYILRNSLFRDAARKGAEWLARNQDTHGAMAIAYNRNLLELKRRAVELISPRRVGDATAQAIRIWLIQDLLDEKLRFQANISKAVQFLLSIQFMQGKDNGAEGGIQYWPGHPTLFSWVGMFSSQALHWAHDPDQSNGIDLLNHIF